jgi:hypothetical protein
LDLTVDFDAGEEPAVEPGVPQADRAVASAVVEIRAPTDEQDPRKVPLGMPKSTPVEWPTIGLAALIYNGWLAMTYFHAHLPIWLVVPMGSWLIAWHSSLQHELLHGHPTRWQSANRAIGFFPLSLWLPYVVYGVVTLLKGEHENSAPRTFSSDRDCLAPHLHSRRAKGSVRPCRNEMTLDVESIVGGCVS